MEISESLQIIKALADSSRLMIVHALHEPQCVEELAERCNLASSTVSFHLGKLTKAGLVRKRKEQYYALFALNDAVFDKSLRELTSFRNAEAEIQEERVRRYRGKVLRTFMKNGRVVKLPTQYKKRLIIVEEILRRFPAKPAFSEKELDEIIREVCSDYVTVRRALIDERLMTRNGGVYRVTRTSPPGSQANSAREQSKANSVKSLQDIKREYKERKKPAGVFQVKNTVNGKILLGSSLNLEGPLNGHRFMLTIGNHRNEELQKDWNKYGADKFVFEILEVVKVKEDLHFNVDDELALLEQIWLEKLQPFGDRGYNTNAGIRQA